MPVIKSKKNVVQYNTRKEEDLNLLQISDFSTGIQVRILPEAGALLHEFSIPWGNRRIQVIQGYQNGADLKKNYASSYKSAKLSPFVCRIAQARYSFGGKSFEFENKFGDGSAIHGLLFNKAFRVVEKTILPQEASIAMEYYYDKDDPAYPFEYKTTILYTLQSSGHLYLKTTVQNCSTLPIPMADGWHPYFSLEGSVNSWLLSFRSQKNIVFDEKLIPLGHVIETSDFYWPAPVGDRSFDHCYLLEPDLQRPAATLENPDNHLRLSLFP